MPWFRISDDATDHPKVLAAGNEAFGLWVRLGSYAARYLTDGAVPAAAALRYGSQDLIDRLVAVRLLDDVEGGWSIHDYLDHNPSRVEILADRAVKKALAVDPELRAVVKARDGNWCRYRDCGRAVSWGDRRTVRGGVLDIVDPDQPAGPDNMVVACRGCQRRHLGRPAEAAGMTLGPARGGQPPAGPRGGRPHAAAVIQMRSRSDPEPIQKPSGSDPGPIQNRSESCPEPIQTPCPYPFPSPLRGGDGNGVGAPPNDHQEHDPCSPSRPGPTAGTAPTAAGAPSSAASPTSAEKPSHTAPAANGRQATSEAADQPRRRNLPADATGPEHARATLRRVAAEKGIRLLPHPKLRRRPPEPAWQQRGLPLWLDIAPPPPAPASPPGPPSALPTDLDSAAATA
ncbi:hypothetical protein [Protofrankia coriariae]|uniref:hypothetical protein n=1 Tax=Protofrankia coriariae TaxID=1562887 RepID=UPI00069A9F13|nr:hypothetical protein [Protofrankia coriariae]